MFALVNQDRAPIALLDLRGMRTVQATAHPCAPGATSDGPVVQFPTRSRYKTLSFSKARLKAALRSKTP